MNKMHHCERLWMSSLIDRLDVMHCVTTDGAAWTYQVYDEWVIGKPLKYGFMSTSMIVTGRILDVVFSSVVVPR